MTSTDLLKEVRTITQNNLDVLKKKFMHLSNEQKNWKPSEYAWNVQEIFAHLNQYATFYHDAFLNRINKTRFKEPKELYQSSPLGRSAWNSMKLGNAKNVKRKFKAARNYNPTFEASLVHENDIQLFENGQKDLLEIIDKANNVNIRKVKVPISMSKIIKLRLGDALLFVVYHNERHVQQALNVLSHQNFPKK
jgi:uncharacterized damage-inducible protein DinB